MGSADITLRHIVRQHPEALVDAMGIDQPVEIVGWLDTQVTALERRLDKALGLRVAGELRALHVEFEYELIASIGRRLHEYQALFSLGRMPGAPDAPAPPIESLVVVLTGRKKPWPPYGRHRTGWPEQRWSGLHYRIDAVYQRTVAELRARESVLWLVFVPLARDATRAAVREVIGELRARVKDPEELGDLLAALLMMADVDPWQYRFREEIAAMVEETSVDLMQVSKTLRDAFEKGIEQGIEKGIEKGRRETALELLRRLFVQRMGRPLTELEQRALAERTARDGDGTFDAQSHALSLEGEALAAWLLDPRAC